MPFEPGGAEVQQSSGSARFCRAIFAHGRRRLADGPPPATANDAVNIRVAVRVRGGIVKTGGGGGTLRVDGNQLNRSRRSAIVVVVAQFASCDASRGRPLPVAAAAGGGAGRDLRLRLAATAPTRRRRRSTRTSAARSSTTHSRATMAQSSPMVDRPASRTRSWAALGSRGSCRGSRWSSSSAWPTRLRARPSRSPPPTPSCTMRSSATSSRWGTRGSRSAST